MLGAGTGMIICESVPWIYVNAAYGLLKCMNNSYT